MNKVIEALMFGLAVVWMLAMCAMPVLLWWDALHPIDYSHCIPGSDYPGFPQPDATHPQC